MVNVDPRLVRLNCQAKARLENQENGSSCPSLRCASDRIKSRPSSRVARETAKKLWKAIQIHERGSVQKSRKDFTSKVLCS